MKLHKRRIAIFTAAAALAACAGCSRTRVTGQTLDVENRSKSEAPSERAIEKTRLKITLPGASAPAGPAKPRPGPSARDEQAWDDAPLATLAVFSARDDEDPAEGRTRVKINGHEIETPAGATLEYEAERDHTKRGPSGETVRRGQSRGAGLDAPGEADVGKFNPGAAELDLGGTDRRGNESHGRASASGASLEDLTGVKGLNWLHAVGALAILAAAFAFFVGRNLRAALLLGGAGLLVFALGMIANSGSVWTVLGVLALGAGCAIAFAWMERSDGDTKVALDRVTRAVAQSGAAGRVVREKLKTQTDAEGTREVVTRAVNAAKRRMRIVDEKRTTTPPSTEASGAADGAPQERR